MIRQSRFPTALSSVLGLAAGLVVLQAQAGAPMSEAERRYVAPATTEKLSTG